MHKLLARLTQRHFGGPPPDDLRTFLEQIDEALRAADSDRALMEHSMETVSEELVERYNLIQRSLAQSRMAESNLTQALSVLSATLESTADGILVVDLNGKIVRTNEQFGRLWRIPKEIIESGDDSRALQFVLDQLEEPETFLSKVRALYAEPDAESFDILRFKDGRVFERYSKPQKVDGLTVGRVWSFRDTTDRRELEGQLRQSQKLEAIGSLAGGIAHDFNNLLTVMQGHADFLKLSIVGPHRDLDDVETILDTVAKAKALTAQLLAFSRKQILQPVNLDINEVVESLRPMLARLIGDDIVIVTDLAAEATTVLVDRGQMEQALVNLAVNARDAMPNGGQLKIETRVAIPDVAAGAKPGLSDVLPSGTVSLRVSDTGSGIPDHIRHRVFEPFFTTKGVGRGTGLGLATVHGIVQQSGGNISVASETGIGTTFTITLPRVASAVMAIVPALTASSERGGGETILLAEDEAGVRELARRILQRYGYTILVAADAEDALRVAESYEGSIDLLLSDVVMPGGGGRRLAQEIWSRRPELRVVFMSGYTDDEIIRRGVLDPSISFLPKPFNRESLCAAVRSALDRTVKDVGTRRLFIA